MTQQELEQKIVRLEGIINALVLSDRFAFSKNLQIEDGHAIQIGTTKGLRIGTDASQKLALWGATPVAQHTDHSVSTALARGLAGSLAEDATWRPVTTAYHIGDLMTAAVEVGILAP